MLAIVANRLCLGLRMTRPDALFVASDTFLTTRRVQLVNLAARHAIPTAFPNRESAEIGGLISYGFDLIDQWRGPATYVERILRGEKPGDLPIQAPTKFELVINMKTAKALGLSIRPAFPLRADEVIEWEARVQRGRLRRTRSRPRCP